MVMIDYKIIDDDESVINNRIGFGSNESLQNISVHCIKEIVVGRCPSMRLIHEMWDTKESILDEESFLEAILSSGLKINEGSDFFNYVSKNNISAETLIHKYKIIKEKIPESVVTIEFSNEKIDKFLIMNIRVAQYSNDFVEKILDLSGSDEKNILIMSDFEEDIFAV